MQSGFRDMSVWDSVLSGVVLGPEVTRQCSYYCRTAESLASFVLFVSLRAGPRASRVELRHMARDAIRGDNLQLGMLLPFNTHTGSYVCMTSCQPKPELHDLTESGLLLPIRFYRLPQNTGDLEKLEFTFKIYPDAQLVRQLFKESKDLPSTDKSEELPHPSHQRRKF
ncbi:hypothetical protein BJ742DRAFT_383982 [Cladochytrium replicatum]|nr:hypothetical protein BJ742DRAFT_383982 [Cladochytrium replicatum]